MIRLGYCAGCHGLYQLRKDGKVRRHRRSGLQCSGANAAPMGEWPTFSIPVAA